MGVGRSGWRESWGQDVLYKRIDNKKNDLFVFYLFNSN